MPGPAEPRVGGYADLRGYGAIGDGRTVALIARDGRIDWLPVPGIASRLLFGALLDEECGGRIELHPEEPFTTERSYVDGTNVLRTRFTTASGVVEVTDALVTGIAGRLPWMQLVRRVQGVAGSVAMRWLVAPGDLLGDEGVTRFDTGTVPLIRSGLTNITLTGSDIGREDPVHPGNGPATDWGPDFRGAFSTSPGSRHVLCLAGTEDEPIRAPDPVIADPSIDRTLHGWQTWAEAFTWDGPWPEQVLRSTLALKLLLFSPSGAIAAAATTSLPESRTVDKNWDYRYAWVRDLSYSVDAFLRFGLREEPHAAVAWALKALKRSTEDGIAVFLDLEGDPTDGVHRHRAEGWRGLGPVVSGNAASGQLQLGVFADLISIMRAYTADGNLLDGASSDLLVDLADRACRSWPRKDSGMWELPVERHYVSSKMGCWQALDAACSLNDMGYVLVSKRTRRRWEKNKRLIRAWVDKHGWDERRGAYRMWKGSRELDASVLLHTVSGFDRGERMSRTIDALRGELGRGPLLYRYSGMEREEGTFVACAFWTVSALACVGRLDEARQLMDELVATVPNDVGIMAEMVEEGTGEFLGNLPQALSHLALVQAASVIRELS
ncbi:glycoside hydrolase family 15 protein [Amnibacterium setariae]|uniref:Glycoside hydrolase family 15 protein n=1 Tax=Amnibacterium setariae TaxID=2306585 RepID=A0A3A1U3C0_9MICO|nr:glycoside hydrolase family 15 protein [Amnibacterium setariae]